MEQMIRAYKNRAALFWDNVCVQMGRKGYYVNPQLSDYKQSEFVRCIRKWISAPLDTVVKTDSFEEAFSVQSVLSELTLNSKRTIELDISPAIVKTAQNKFCYKFVFWMAADISQMPIRKNAVDLIFSSSTYGYVNDINGALKEAYRILKPGGTLIITVNNKYNLFLRISALSSSFLNIIPFPLSRAFTTQEFKRKLQDAGFLVKEYEPIVFIVPFLHSLTAGLAVMGFIRFHDWVIKKICSIGNKKTILRYFLSWFIIFKVTKPEY